MQFDLKYLSEYRTQLMGIAALMVMLCHAPAYGVHMSGTMAKLVASGGLGVEIFLFLSGIGCWYSLQKHGAQPWTLWYRHRFVRIFIPYALMQIPFWTYDLIVGKFEWGNHLFVFSTLKFWTAHQGAWYVALLVPLYAITPPLYEILQRCKSRGWRLCVAAVLSVLIMMICFMDFDNFHDNNVVDNLRWAFQKTVNFVIGMAVAPYVKQGKRVNIWPVVLCCLCSFIVVHQFVSKNVYMDWCKVPFLLLAFVCVLQYIKRLRWISCFVSWMGIVSLESYLANIYLCGEVSDFAHRIGWHDNDAYAEYLLVLVLGWWLSWCVNRTTKATRKCISLSQC